MIEDRDGDEHRLPGKVAGGVVVYQRSWCTPHLYLVTHLASSCEFAAVFFAEDALKVGAVCATEMGGAFNAPTKADCVKLLPKWAEAWARACRKAGAYVDPAPYRKRGK